MFLDTYIDVLGSITGGAVSVCSWLFSPLDVLGIPPIFIVTGGGLLVYLTIAIAKWLIS